MADEPERTPPSVSDLTTAPTQADHFAALQEGVGRLEHMLLAVIEAMTHEAELLGAIIKRLDRRKD